MANDRGSRRRFGTVRLHPQTSAVIGGATGIMPPPPPFAASADGSAAASAVSAGSGDSTTASAQLSVAAAETRTNASEPAWEAWPTPRGRIKHWRLRGARSHRTSCRITSES
eukprot:GHVU01058788.1.p2 GENE.GHVU01058788.1~~GHVU01058788.1.p2  ORF type:complete len:112 (+),score=5.24 GHVU01058788.1:469-804(+)